MFYSTAGAVPTIGCWGIVPFCGDFFSIDHRSLSEEEAFECGATSLHVRRIRPPLGIAALEYEGEAAIAERDRDGAIHDAQDFVLQQQESCDIRVIVGRDDQDDVSPQHIHFQADRAITDLRQGECQISIFTDGVELLCMDYIRHADQESQDRVAENALHRYLQLLLLFVARTETRAPYGTRLLPFCQASLRPFVIDRLLNCFQRMWMRFC